jgi:hypothetical protein
VGLRGFATPQAQPQPQALPDETEEIS